MTYYYCRDCGYVQGRADQPTKEEMCGACGGYRVVSEHDLYSRVVGWRYRPLGDGGGRYGIPIGPDE